MNFTEDVESMTGEIENGDLAVRDVADLLQAQYAIIAGKYLILHLDPFLIRFKSYLMASFIHLLQEEKRERDVL